MDISELKRSLTSDSKNRHPWELARIRVIDHLLKKQSIPFNTIIDFGSGDIYLLRQLELKKMAKKYYAIDNAYSDDIVTTLKTRYPSSDITLLPGITAINEKSVPADCFLFLDVIEHCADDNEILKLAATKPYTHQSSTILVTVPAFQSLYSSHDRLLKHYRRYNLKQLATACNQSGLHVSATGYFFFSLLPVRIFQLFLEKIKLRIPVKSIDNWQGGKRSAELLSWFLWLDFRLSFLLNKVGIKLPGLSCYCICHPFPS